MSKRLSNTIIAIHIALIVIALSAITINTIKGVDNTDSSSNYINYGVNLENKEATSKER